MGKKTDVLDLIIDKLSRKWRQFHKNKASWNEKWKKKIQAYKIKQIKESTSNINKTSQIDSNKTKTKIKYNTIQ